MSPLRWFRRHATWMLIIFGVVLMAIFGLGPVFDQMARGFQNSGPVDDPVIMEYRGGEITRSSLDELQRNHHSTRRFLIELIEQSAKQCEKKEVQYAPLADMVQPLARTDDQDVVDEQMLVRKLLAERAEDEGVVISEGMIDDYLALMAGQAEFSPRDWKQINKLVNQRTPMTKIRQHLALELKSLQMQRYASIGVPLNPVPTEAIELYARSNDRIECEFIPVKVEDYVSKVSGEPSREEMQALFKEGKYEYVDIGMQTPGFKIPRKANVQYFTAEKAVFLQNEKSKLTDAQVEAEYEKLIAAEDPIVVEIISQPEPAGFELDFGNDAKKMDDPEAKKMAEPEMKKMDEPEMKKMAEPEMKKTDEPEMKKMADPKMEKTEGSDLKIDPDVPVLKMPKAKTVEPLPNADGLLKELPVEVTPDAPKVTPVKGTGDQSLNVRKTKSQFASFTQDEAQETGSETTETETPATEGATDQEDVGGIGDLQLSDESAGPSTGQSNKKTRIKPLSEVADEIRTRLATAAAFKKKDDAAKRAKIALDSYRSQVIRWENSQEKETTPKPTPPDFAAIAKEYGLLFQETGLVNRFELEKTDIGKVNYFVQVQTPQGGLRPDFQSVSNKIFLEYDRVDLLVPQNISDIVSGNAYVIWTSEKEEVRIPEFEESKDQIVKYWKHQKAVELARKAAEAMAAKASPSQKLTSIFPTTASPTGEFTWFRPGRGAMAIYGTPIKVDRPGEEFMKTAFSLAEGEASVAANESRDIIYVLQRITPAIPVADIGQEYLDDQFFRFKRIPTGVMGAAQHYAQEIEFDWRDEFVKSMELKRMK